MLTKNRLKEKLFGLTKESSIWLGIITLVIIVSQKIFSGEISSDTTLLIIALVVTSLVFQGYLISSAVKKDFFDRIHDLEAFIKDHGMDKIVSEKSLTLVEKNSQEIWVFTKDLKNDIPGKEDADGQSIAKTVQENLSNGKKYVYFVPDNAYIRGKINEYRNQYRPFVKNSEQVRFVKVENNYFHFPSEIAFYDPNETYKGVVQVVQYFPDDNVNYYIGYDDAYQNDFFGKASWLLNNPEITKSETF